MSLNRKYPLLIAVLLLLFSTSSAWSAVYKCEDVLGRIKFSDEPCSRGESTSSMDWLKRSYNVPAKKTSKKPLKTSRKSIKTKEPVVLVTLLTTTQLELNTVSLTSTRGNEVSEGIELVLSDGIRLDLIKVKTIKIKKSMRNNEIIAQITMHDGLENTQTIQKPYPVISGDINIGRFSKSLEDIKSLEFFNSDKLPQRPKVKKAVAHTRVESQAAKPQTAKDEVPVIELDLSEKTQTYAKPVAQPRIKTSAIPYRQHISGTDKTVSHPVNKQSAARAAKPFNTVAVTLADDNHLKLQKNSLVSQRGSSSANNQLLLSNEVKIPFSKIKQIKVRPTSDQSALVVAVHLLTGEIKMENMSPPFTRISGQGDTKAFSHSLLDIKSIRLQ